ncbi:MAG: hypothetical protein LRZ94_00865 [Candidatus Pacebacteria bacterium]|nr:hypothetical protein [Candidatus Paceibacterota bacterium]
MSYEIVKAVKIENDRVMIKGASNNVYPKNYEYWECHPLTKTLREKGKEQAEIDILKAYEEGNFQAGTENKYTRALKILRYLSEYERFDWRNKYKGDEDNDKIIEQRRESKEFDELLLKVLNTKLPKQKFVITKKVGNDEEKQVIYMKYRKNAGYCKWYTDIKKAKKFDFLEEAESIKKYFTNSENWEIIRV